MLKTEFLQNLRHSMADLPYGTVENTIEYYSEMIDDRMEDGKTEEDAVREMGDPEAIAAQLRSDTPPVVKPEPQKAKRKLGPWAITLLALGSPIWFSLLITAGAVLISAYAVLWSVVVTLYAVTLALGAVAVAGVFCAILCLVQKNFGVFAVYLGAGFICAGLCMLLLYVSNYFTKGICFISKKLFSGLISCFKGRSV